MLESNCIDVTFSTRGTTKELETQSASEGFALQSFVVTGKTIAQAGRRRMYDD